MSNMKNIALIAALFISVGLFAATAKETVNHRVEPKETLFKISLMYNSTVNDIIQANPGLTPKTMHAGATIKVPKNTKIRDAAFVETFLTDKLVFTPINKIATLIKTESPVAAKAKTVSTEPTASISSQTRAYDENPFLTPSEPRSGPAADEQPNKEQQIAQPATASGKDEEVEEENPFVTPKQKSGPKQ
jgi:LysM repeat protein